MQFPHEHKSAALAHMAQSAKQRYHRLGVDGTEVMYFRPERYKSSTANMVAADTSLTLVCN
jgi:hypothetical protein